MRVVIDTNIWISYLIGKQLVSLTDQIVSKSISLILCDQLLEEIILVTKRPKLTKYFKAESVNLLIEWMKIAGEKYDIDNISEGFIDPKDDFLITLSKESQADYLVTGDKALLELRSIQKTAVIDMAHFSKLIESLDQDA